MAEAKLTITTNAPQVAEELKQVDSEIKNITKSQKYMFDNAEIIAKSYGGVATAIRDTQKAQQELSVETEKGMKREKGLVEDIQDEIKKWEEAWRKAGTKEEIAKINAKIDEAKQNLKEYAEVGVESNKKIGKSTDELAKKVESFAKKWGIVGTAIALVTKVFKDVVGVIKDTTIGMNALTQAGEFWKQLTYNIATGNFNMADSFRAAANTAQQINKLREKELKDIIIVSKLKKNYNQLYFESSNLTKTDTERYGLLNQAMLAHNILIEKETERLKDNLEIVRSQRVTRFNSFKLRKQEAELIAQITDLEGRAFSETKRLERQMTGLLAGFFDGVHSAVANVNDAIAEWEQAYADDRLKIQQEYQDVALKLMEDFEQSQIDALEGKEKLEAQRKYAVEQLKEVRTQLTKLGTLTEDQKKMLQQMADNIWDEYYKQLAELSKDKKPTPEQQEAISEALIGDLAPLPGLIKKDVEKAQAEIDKIVAANEAMEPVSIWNLVGLDPEDDEDAGKIEAIKEVTNALTDAMDEIYSRRLENAERTREILDRQISETQRSLELEAQLYEDGYANNVDAKRKELEELQKQRQQALVEEQKAIKQQQAIERISQAINIASSASNILKQFTKLGPVGLALASVAIASLFTIWASTKAKAYSATELAEGGSGDDSGMITGKRHSQGGEKFLDHVEVESGESWGVLSRPASEKYGKVFHEIVNSFNKDQMPQFMPVSNNVRVENSGPNSRLDKVITEQRRLNDNLLKQSFITQSGGKKIIKQGNKIRIVG